MPSNPLTQSIEQFARHLAALPDASLDRPWGWQSYDSEGVRFAFFRTYEDLRDLAARLAQQRARSDRPLTEAEHILAQYHTAYRNLRAALLGLTVEQMQQPPAEKEWPVRGALAHLLGADIGFYVVMRFALDRLRGGETEPARPTEEDWSRISGLDEPGFEALMRGPLDDLLAYFDRQHAGVIETFATLGAEELDAPSLYWEDEPYSLRFRLHRFDSHMRQHTIQIDKTLAALGLLPTETRRLLRLIYAALAEVEGTLIGIDPETLPELGEVAWKIDARLMEMERAVG